MAGSNNGGPTGVLILSPFYEPNVGGVETHLKDLVEALRRRKEYQAWVLTYQPITTRARGRCYERVGNVRIIRIPWIGLDLFNRLEPYPVLEFLYLTPWLFLWTFFFLVVRGSGIQAIHAHGLNAALIGRLLGKLFGKRVVVSLHAIYAIKSRSRFSMITAWVLNGASRVLTLCEASRRELQEAGVDPDRIHVFRYWVDQSLFRPMDKDEAKRGLGWGGKFVVLFVGRLIEIKGMDLLLEASDDTPDSVLFAFAGDGPCVGEIERAASRRANVCYVGRISNPDLPLYYAAADLVAVPSKYDEGFGRVILEALSCGTPVLASRRGGIPEAMDDTVGILVEPTAGRIREEVVSLLDRPERLREMAMCCRSYAVDRFSEKNAEEILGAYHG